MRDGIALYAPDLADTDDGFDPGLFGELARLEPGNFWFEPRRRLLCGLARRFFPGCRRILEVGSGTGFLLDGLAEAFPTADIVGSELHPSGLALARARLGDRASFVQMDARDMPARQAFDLVCLFDVIEHIEDEGKVLRQACKVLRPEGGIIVSVPQHPSLWSATDDAAHHVRRYCAGELEAKLRAAGFAPLFSTSYVSLLLPLMVLSRRRRRDAAPGVHPIFREMRVPAAANAVLRWVLDLEVRLTLKGLRWAAGGSRVIVARKACAAALAS